MNSLFFRVLTFPFNLLEDLFSAPGKLLSSGKRVLGFRRRRGRGSWWRCFW